MTSKLFKTKHYYTEHFYIFDNLLYHIKYSVLHPLLLKLNILQGLALSQKIQDIF